MGAHQFNSKPRRIGRRAVYALDDRAGLRTAKSSCDTVLSRRQETAEGFPAKAPGRKGRASTAWPRGQKTVGQKGAATPLRMTTKADGRLLRSAGFWKKDREGFPADAPGAQRTRFDGVAARTKRRSGRKGAATPLRMTTKAGCTLVGVRRGFSPPRLWRASLAPLRGWGHTGQAPGLPPSGT